VTSSKAASAPRSASARTVLRALAHARASGGSAERTLLAERNEAVLTRPSCGELRTRAREWLHLLTALDLLDLMQASG